MKNIFLLSFISIYLFNNAQNYGNNWCFGSGIRLNFNDCEPIVQTSANSGSEGCSAISDINGDLLFYTNSDHVWNKNDNIMTNGNLGGVIGTHSQVIIVPKPLSGNRYYIFTTQRQDYTGIQKFRYSEVDMSLNGGLGSVIVQNVDLTSLNTNEEVTATYHSNGTDIWVLTHEYGTSNFLAYLVTSSGISSSPIISSVGSSHLPCSANVNSAGNMKFSPNGNKLAFNGHGENNNPSTNILELFDFNNSTGVVSNIIKLRYLGNEYGLSFSPDNTKLYCTTWTTGSITAADSNYLYQFDISSNDSTSIANSRTILHSGYCLDNQFGTANIGPDGKVYVTKHDQQYLGVIEFPNLSGLACNYIDSGIYLNGLTSNFGLTNYIEYKLYCNSSGLNENNFSNTLINIYPNPTIGKLTIKGINENYNIKIYNAVGQTLYTEMSIHNNQKEIDVSTFDNDFLYIEIEVQERTQYFKITKAK